MMYTVSCLTLSFLAISALAQVPQRFTTQNPCSSNSSCQNCIRSPSCAWCYDPQFTGRCFQPLKDDPCKEEFTYNPDNIMKMMSNQELSKAHSANSAGGGQRIVQVAPQKINLKLRTKKSYSIFMSYTQAVDYPLDLYYLMDLSRSMSDDKEKLSSLGDQLAETMQNITSDFTLGFGSFVDKVVMPNVRTSEQLLRPCDVCVAPYGFHHHMSLSTNTDLFSKMVKQANVSVNLDGPAGGLDAIMQAVECRNQIGWRYQAKRLLVVSTDASFHIAGDGKLGGIVNPNDGRCHITSDGYYGESSNQDYPSIEQINLALKRNSINVIFAVTGNTVGVYDQLAKQIETVSTVKLEKDSSNIVELIREQYEQISSSVEMKHNASSDVSIQIFTKCLNASGPLVNTNKCGNIKVGDVITFKIDVEVLKCPRKRKDRFETIQIYPVGINENLVINLKMLCKCDCEKPGNKTCPDRCLEFRDCVQCQMYATGPLKHPELCSVNCANVPVPFGVDKIEAIEENNEYLCHYTDEDHCQFTYVYYYDTERNLHIRAQENRTCPPARKKKLRI